MNIAFLNLCHCDPQVVARVSAKLTLCPNFDMYIHVDQKSDITPFIDAVGQMPRVFFLEEREKVYWGGFNAVKATIRLLKAALESGKGYNYFVLLQNLDYPIRSNAYILDFFQNSPETEYLRGCKIAGSTDWHYAKKYKLYNKRDDDFYLKPHPQWVKKVRYFTLALRSIPKLFFPGVIREDKQEFPIYYGAAQWAVTRSCAEYLVNFYETHPKFNRLMSKIQFPDEEYFHTAVHNSPYKYKCVKYDEPEKRWLVNWRNLHYFEYPKEITVLDESCFDRIMSQDNALFIRKVRTGQSDILMNKIDQITS